MAPIGQSHYFPPLDKCLDGGYQLLSWKTTFVGLSQLGDIPDNGSLKRHLQDPETIKQLASPLSPFSTPNSHTKSSFETKTSAINISPLSQGRYDIKELQEDSLWLSKEAKIDEIAALRIVVLEWQTRPLNRLLQCSSYDEITKLGRTIGSSSLQTSFSISRSSISNEQAALVGDKQLFDSSQSRRLRLLYIYLSERLYILKVSEWVVFGALYEASLHKISESSERLESDLPDRLGWAEELGNDILSAWNLNGVARENGKNFIVNAVDALQSRVENLEKGQEWLHDDELKEDVELVWGRNQLLEIIQIMQLILTLLNASTKLTRADTFLAWFKFMGKHDFFQTFKPPLESLQNIYDVSLQSLVALVSLAVLNVPVALDMVLENSLAAISAADSQNDAPYLLNLDAINESKDVFADAALACLPNASLAVLGWSIIFQTARDCVIVSKESREIRQSRSASDKYGVADLSDTDGAERFSMRGSPSPSSDLSQPSSFLEAALDKILSSGLEDDMIGYLAKSAVDGSQVFEVITDLATNYCSDFGSEHSGKPSLKTRRMLLDLIRAVLEWIEYQPILLIATLAVLTGNDSYWDTLNHPQGLKDSEPSAFFLNDFALTQKLFRTALARFPYEMLPFLQFCRALAVSGTTDDEEQPIIPTLLQNIDSLTCKLSAKFGDYKIVREDEDANYIQLTSNMNVFDSSNSSLGMIKPDPRSRVSTKIARSMNSLELPSGTIGRVLSDTKPLVVMWRYDYSVLNYMGRVLQHASLDSSSSSGLTTPMVSREILSEIIDLLTVIISSIHRKNSDTHSSSAPHDLIQTILENASDGLDRNQDVVSIIFEIFENELHRRRSVSDEESPLDVLHRCIQFTHALLPVMPDRVWPFLGRSSLLGINGVESQLGAITTSVERTSGRYGFLLGCIRVYDALVDDAISSAVSRKAPTTAIKRFAVVEKLGSRISQTLMEKIILSFQRTMVNVFESLSSWKFNSQDEKLEINAWLCSIFSKILSYSFEINDQTDLRQKLIRPLSSAAQYILDVFLPLSSSNISVPPLLQILLDGVAAPDSSLSTKTMHFWNSQIVACNHLITALIRINNLLEHPRSSLEDQIFKVAPVLTKLYAVHEEFRLPIVDLFSALILCADSTDHQPPSLLGHLGQDTASWFLEILSVVDQPLSDNDLSIGIWRLLSTVVSRRQQWLAIFVLTGNTPRDTLKDGRKLDTIKVQRAESLLGVALDSLSNIERLEPTSAAAMLEFVALAADHWPWVLSVMEEHPHFLTAIREFLEFSEPKFASAKEKFNKVSTNYMQLQISSFIMNVLAMYVHHTQQTGNSKYATKILPNLSFLSQLAVRVPSYNSSLHGNLGRNLESKFPGCALIDFKRTTINIPQLGPSFYYDLEKANKMLSFDTAWIGRRSHGFADEMVRANINFSLVDTQINLFHSWKFLAIEMGQCLGTDREFQSVMIKTTIGCLQSNSSVNLPENIFKRLAFSRAQLAFTLLQQFIEAKMHQVELKDILPAAWDAIRNHETDVGLGLTGESAGYYRLLLKILCLALQTQTLSPLPSRSELHKSWSSGANDLDDPLAASKTVQIVLEILGVIVARGFCSLTIALHDDPARVMPADFALIIAILRTGLHVPGITNHNAQLLSQFSDNQTVRCASALLSWSDQIVTDHDPIYGELSISLLLELSNVPILAENLAVEGILTQILGTNLISYLRQERGMGPFDNPVRLYSIWSRGLLPLLLNLLHTIGAAIASEISSTLNKFPGQLSRASSTFGSKPISITDPTAGSITLSMVSEAQNLAIIFSILETFREAGPSAGVIVSQIAESTWDKTQVKEDIELWMQRRAALRDRIVPTNKTEEAWVSQQPSSSASGAENLLEEKVVREMNTVFTMLGGSEQ